MPLNEDLMSRAQNGPGIAVTRIPDWYRRCWFVEGNDSRWINMPDNKVKMFEVRPFGSVKSLRGKIREVITLMGLPYSLDVIDNLFGIMKRTESFDSNR
jgi:hypothetical protein